MRLTLHWPLEASDRVLIACSGGLDSIVLLHSAKAHGFNIVVAHVDHGLRPESKEDLDWCSQLCDAVGIPFVHATLHDLEAGQSNARRRRYAALVRLAHEVGAVAIATGHHADDAVETLLDRFGRGAGLSGLTGLRHESAHLGMRVIRPLLDHSRADLERVAAEHGWTWREDATNATTAYRRNELRHELVPKLAETSEPLRRSVQLLRQDAALLEEATQNLLSAASSPSPGRRTDRYVRSWLDSASPSMRDRAIVQAAHQMGVQLEAVHIENLRWDADEPRSWDVPRGSISISREFVTIRRTPAVDEVCESVAINLDDRPTGALPWYDSVVLWGTFDDGLHLKLGSPEITIRGPVASDEVDGVPVREILRAAKVASEDRWRWPCIESGGECAAVVGVRSESEAAGEHDVSFRLVRRARG